MDITLIPTKLNGQLIARPSRVYSLLHATCQALALHQVRAGIASADAAKAGNAKEYKRLPGCWSEELKTILDCFSVMPGDAPTLYCSDSLNVFHMMVPVAAAFKQKVSFTGSGDYPNSEILPVTAVLKRRGVSFNKGNLKIKRRDRDRMHEIFTMTHRMEYGGFSLTGRETPWFLTGLLLALPLLEGNSSVRMTTMPESMEMPDMAISVLRQYGVTVLRSVDDYGYPYFEIPGNQCYQIPATVSLEGDWTRAAFWLGCGALGGNVTVRGLSGDSHQVSRQILDKLHALGAMTSQGTDSANVVSGKLQGCNINASRIPDLVPILSVIMASARGTSMLTGINSDDYYSVFRVLDAFEADISDGGSGFSFTGRAILSGGEINAEGDPTMAMVATAASCLCRMPVTIRNAGVINKKYPGFFEDYAALGGKIEGKRDV